METIVCALSTIHRALGVSIHIFSLTAKAIDRYIQTRNAEQSGSKEKMDVRLSHTIENIFGRCIAEKEYKQVRNLVKRNEIP